ncbi:MFS general substrate transporter [Phanerochaete sordida]|uniref:MFS general substrate transporter n=1 Tax=Phanerochaete sordida TaxID=48140 RepID=A0A9P3GCP4_9APHY|nr:MFS general substrate transporter [Phanerochaete sordida]
MVSQRSSSDADKFEDKEPVVAGDDASVVLRDDDGDLLLPEVRKHAEKRLVRKLDVRLLPTIVLFFILNYIDRTAISSARLKGIEKDVHISDIQYENVLAVLYASYVPAQIPSNMFLNRISRPSIYISACVCIWGMASALTGVTKNYGGLLAARIFVGIPEAVFYPGAIFLLSRWYTRKELALRSALLYSGLLISNAFGSLMAAGILANLEGKLGVRAWRWLFYIEGAMTVFIGMLAVWTLPDYPHNTRWLSKAERRLAQVRLAEDAGEADEDSIHDTALTGLKQALLDPKVYIFAIMTCSLLLGSSFVNFFPTLTATLGFSTTVSLLLAAPPWILATALCCVNAWHADRTGERFFHVAGPWWSIMVGYIIGLSTASVGGRYVALFLMAAGYAVRPSLPRLRPPPDLRLPAPTPAPADRSGERFLHLAVPWWGVMVGYAIGLGTHSVGGRYVALFLMASGYAGFALTLVWTANAVPRPPAKRAAAMGIVNGVGNLGNLIGSYAWKAQWGPDYHPSMIIGLASFGLASALALLLRQILIAQNRQLDRREAAEMGAAERERIAEAARLEGVSLADALERKKGFRYLY